MAQAQTTQAGTEAHGGDHAEVGFPPFETETFGGQLFWLIVTFAALYTLMSKLVLPRPGGILEGRRQAIARDLDEAAAMKTRAEEAGAAYEKSLAEARARAQASRQEPAPSSARNRRPSARPWKRTSARLAQAEAAIAVTKNQAMSNVRGIARETTVAIVERLTGRAPSPQAVDAALDQS